MMRAVQIFFLFSHLMLPSITAFTPGVNSWVRRFAVTTVMGGEPLVVKPPSAPGAVDRDPSSSSDTALILLPGCLLGPEKYASLAEAIQSHSSSTAASSNLWITVPKVPFDAANPLTVESAFLLGQEALREAGFQGDTIFLGGHSLGSAFLHQIDLPKSVAGLVYLGGFPPRKDDKDMSASLPSLTIAGALDGLVRVSRIAESYHACITNEGAKLRNPVVLVEGMNHFGFIDGIVHPLKEYRDLDAEISHDTAIQAIASTIAEFINVHHVSPTATSATAAPQEQRRRDLQAIKDSLSSKVAKTGEFLAPLLQAMSMEGSYHLETPCHLCVDEDDDDAMEQSSLNCKQGSPWAEQVQEELALNAVAVSGLGGDEEFTLTNVKDEFRQSWCINPFADSPFPFPKVLADRSKRQFSLQTVTEAVYEKAEHFLDTGFFSNTALELRSKLNSPEAIQRALGKGAHHRSAPSSDGNTCSQINAQTIQWALENAPSIVRHHYLERGMKMAAGRDIPKHSGPGWIWSYLDYRDDTCTVEDIEEECRLVDSPTLATPVDFPIPAVGGKLYCKLLSPARVLDWMYTDCLRFGVKRDVLQDDHVPHMIKQ